MRRNLYIFKEFSDEMLKKLKNKEITEHEMKEKISFAQIQLLKENKWGR